MKTMNPPGNSSAVSGVRDWPEGSTEGYGFAQHIGTATLRTRRKDDKRGILGGRRYLSVWRHESGDTYLFEMKAGKHRNIFRLTDDAVAALASIYADDKAVVAPASIYADAKAVVASFVTRLQSRTPPMAKKSRDTSDGKEIPGRPNEDAKEAKDV